VTTLQVKFHLVIMTCCAASILPSFCDVLNCQSTNSSSPHQDEIITLRRKLQQADTEITMLKGRLLDSEAQVAAATSSDTSRTHSVASLNLAIDSLKHDISSLRCRVASADRNTAFANMESMFHASRCRAANAVAAALPPNQYRSLQSCATLRYDLDVKVRYNCVN
jgi:hypothetical protein